MNKKYILRTAVTLIVVAAILLAVRIWDAGRHPSRTTTNTPTPIATTTTSVDASLAQPGERCGGNMTTAKSCTTGYHCAPEAGSHLPFGDVGGICVKN